MSWNDIIEHVPSEINKKLGFLRRIKAYLPVSARLTIFNGFVLRIFYAFCFTHQRLIVGDMNIHVDDASDADVRNFLDLLESLGLKQHVRGPTHIHGHTLLLPA